MSMTFSEWKKAIGHPELKIGCVIKHKGKIKKITSFDTSRNRPRTQLKNSGLETGYCDHDLEADKVKPDDIVMVEV